MLCSMSSEIEACGGCAWMRMSIDNWTIHCSRLCAYSRIYKNDGMSLPKIEAIIAQLRYERFRWTPGRRVEIPKKNGKKRPLGLPTWTDKLVQEVIRLILEAFYEPQFSNSSHGFRPGRGCHSALTTIDRTWQGTKWFLEGDIRGCFDHIDHDVLMEILREKIKDNRFLRLLENLLKAGYCEEWNYRPTLSGTPRVALSRQYSAIFTLTSWTNLSNRPSFQNIREVKG